MSVLEPSPGTLKPLVFVGAVRSVAGGTASGDAIDDRGGVASMSGMGRFCHAAACCRVAVDDDRQHLLAQADELGSDFTLRVSPCAEELARERHVVVDVRDAPRARAHDDQVGREEQRLLDRRG